MAELSKDQILAFAEGEGGDIVQKMAARLTAEDAHDADAVREQNRLWREEFRRQTAKPLTDTKNPLLPAVKAIHVLIDARDSLATEAAWTQLVARVENFAHGQYEPRYPWVSRTEDARRLRLWMWEITDGVVRHCLFLRSPQLGRVLIEALSGLYLAGATSERQGELGSRQASEIALLALNEGAHDIVVGVVALYERATRFGMVNANREVFRQGCLGLGHLGELACGRPRSGESIVARNNSDVFANPVDVGHLVAKTLSEVAYRFREAEWPFPPTALSDAIALSFQASVAASDARRFETSLDLVHAMGELLVAAIGAGDSEDLVQVSFELGDMARSLSRVPQGNEYVVRAWDALGFNVIRVLAEGKGLDAGMHAPRRVIIDNVAKQLPTKVRNDLGEIAWRNFLQYGTPKLKEVRESLEAELGLLPGWYV